MAEFMTRVELHHEQSGDYTRLHEQMAARGFSRYLFVSGQKSHMPDATYFLTSINLVPRQVYELAREATNAIGREAGIVVAQTAYAQTWAGGLYPAQ